MTYIDGLDQAEVASALAGMRDDPRGRELLAEHPDDENFVLWILLWDRWLLRRVGVSHRDLADWTWRDAYADGAAPSDACVDALGYDDTFRRLL